MKKGYTKVLIIELVMIFILIINSFAINILSNFRLVLFLFLSLCLFKIFFHFEKDRHRNTKDIVIYLAIYLLITIIIYSNFILSLSIAYSATSCIYSKLTKSK